MPSVIDLVQVGEPLRTSRRNIPYLMLHERGQGYKERWEPTVVNASFVALVDWDQGNDWIVDMIGEHRATGAGQLTRFNPEPHPFFPSLYCQGLNETRSDGRLGMDPDVMGGLSYDFAVYECTFLPVPYVMGSNAIAWGPAGELSRYVIRDRKSAGESIQAAGMFQFIDGKPVTTPPTIQTCVGKLDYTWLYLPDPIDNVLSRADAWYGRTNDATFDGIHLPDTLLFLGAEASRIPMSPAGNALWSVKFSFARRWQTWQVSYRPSAFAPPGDWAAIVNRDTNAPPYARAPMQNLFTL